MRATGHKIPNVQWGVQGTTLIETNTPYPVLRTSYFVLSPPPLYSFSSPHGPHFCQEKVSIQFVSTLHGWGLSTIIQPLFSGGNLLVTQYDTMSRFPTIIAVVLTGLWLSGCTSSPWLASRPTLALLKTPTPARSTASFAASVASNQPDPQKMQEVMAELRQLGALDPAAQDQLLEDLRESDPSLWPLVMQQFRATTAYRRRAMEREKGTGPICAKPGTDRRLVAGRSGKLDPSPFPAAERLPAVNDVAVAPSETPRGTYPSTSDTPMEAESPANQTLNQVVQASYTASVAEDWRQRLAGTIAMLEAEVPKNPTTPAEMAQHARLRMLYAAAGRREDAVRPIPAAPPSAQQFLSKELEGLTTWLNVEQAPDAARRAAETKPALVEALGKLAESAPLAVRNTAFCTEVQSYGCVKRFEKYEFQPNQEVLLYAEVENFASEPTPQGYHTSLRSSYQIIDAGGRRVAEHAFAATEEHCQNLRRDFFIGYHLRLPKGIGPGKYTLQLSIEDLKCRKVGQAAIEFEVKRGKGEGGRGKVEEGREN